MRIWLTCILTALFVIAADGADSLPPESEQYDLEIIFADSFIILIVISVGRPFELIATHVQAHYAVSGLLQPPKEGKYPIELTIYDKYEDAYSLQLITKPELELGKPLGVCSTGGVTQCWSFTLRKHESPLIRKMELPDMKM
jgi:hypothetical protein